MRVDAFLFLALAMLCYPCNSQDSAYTLILDLKDVTEGVFSTSLLSSGLENENDPSANTYSIIGNLDEDELRDDNGRFNFKLVFMNVDGTVDELVWSQESWLTDATIVGADLSSISDDKYSGTSLGFHGLSLSSNENTYLDGSDQSDYWYHTVGLVTAFANFEFPGHNLKSAKAESLYMMLDLSSAEPDCGDYNMDVVLNKCSADFPAEKEALEAVRVRVSQLESEAATSANLATTDATVEALSAELQTLQSEAATSANLAATDIAVRELSSRLNSIAESWKEPWETSARSGLGIKIGAEDIQDEPAAYVIELSARSPMIIGALALLAVLVAANLYFVFRSCSARENGKYDAVDFTDSEEMAPIRV